MWGTLVKRRPQEWGCGHKVTLELCALFSLSQAPHTITALLPEGLPRLRLPLPMTVTDPRSQAGAKHL